MSVYNAKILLTGRLARKLYVNIALYLHLQYVNEYFCNVPVNCSNLCVPCFHVNQEALLLEQVNGR